MKTQPNSEPISIAQNTIRGINAAGQSDHFFVMQTFGQDIEPQSRSQPHLGGKLYSLLFARNLQTGSKMSYGEFSNDGTLTKLPTFPANILTLAVEGYFEARGQQIFNQNSLEGFHDDIHVHCGQGSGATNNMGHMSFIEYAAMDPIFWLHHT